MSKKLLSIVLALVMALVMLPMAAMATGAEADLVISDEADLIDFAENIATYKYANVQLGDDIELTKAWSPIGGATRKSTAVGSGTAFSGTFDGQGYTISGLTISGDASVYGSDVCVGLFSALDGATVKDLELDVAINVPANDCAGAVAGLSVGNTTISGVTVNGSVAAAESSGGLVGRMIKEGHFEDCVNNATITGGGKIGGIVGGAYYQPTNTGLTITNCVNNGTVTSTAGYVGGIAGLSAGVTTGCTNNADITGVINGIGGIVGQQAALGTVTECVNNGKIIAGSTAYGAGGIVGWARYDDKTNYEHEVIAVTNNVNYGVIDGGNAAGGIIGTLYNAGTVTGNENYAPSLTGTSFAAGIVANLQYDGNNGFAKQDGVAAPVTITGNSSATAAENISANCTNLYVYNNEDTYFTNVKDNGVAYVAQIDEDNKFPTLQAAFDAAKQGDTIELLSDITLTEQIKVTDQAVLNQITLDGNNHTITANLDQASQSVLYFGDTSTNAWACDVDIKDLTIKGTARFAIALMGGTQSELTNVTIKGDYVYGINLYGTHGADMVNCDVTTVFTNAQDEYPLTLTNTTIDTLYANKSDVADDKGKITIDSDSSVGTLYFWGDSTKMVNSGLEYVDSIISVATEAAPEAKIGNVQYTTLAVAIAAAEDDDTIYVMPGTYNEAINPWGADSTHKSEKSITLLGAAEWCDEGETILTGGMYLGYDDGKTRDHAITVKGFTFQGKGLTVADQKNVTIENNIFTDIDGRAILVMDLFRDGAEGTATITDNVITKATTGIEVRRPHDAYITDNAVTDTADNAILVSGASAAEDEVFGDIKITGNELTNWGTSGEGRGIRVTGGETIVISGNTLTNDKAHEEFIKIADALTADSSVCITENKMPADAPIQVKGAVAQTADDTYYFSLQAAVDAAAKGDEIVLLSDVELAESLVIAADDEIVLELNGKKLSGLSVEAASSYVVENKGKLTVQDSSEEETGLITTEALYPDTDWDSENPTDQYPSYANNTISNRGVLILESGTIENTSPAGGACYAIDNYDAGSITVNGGAVSNNNYPAIRMFAGSESVTNRVTIDGGTVTGTRAVWMQLTGSDTTVAPKAELTVTGGKLVSSGYTDRGDDYRDAIYCYSYGNSRANAKITISDDAVIEGDVLLTGGSNKTVAETVTITGGTFVNPLDGVVSYAADDVAAKTINISGGTFAAAFNEVYLADLYTAVPDGDNWVVERITVDMSGDVVEVDAQTAQAVLDGAFGSIDGKTIHFTESIDEVLVLARPTKYQGSNTVYYNYVNSKLETEPTEWSEDISTIMNSHSHYYRTVENVTFTADEDVTLAGFAFTAGHAASSGYDYVRDVEQTSGVTHYAHSTMEGITFDGLTISGNVYFQNALEDTEVTGITFENCIFNGETASSSMAAINMISDNNYYPDVTLENCSFNNVFQGIHIQGADGLTIKNNTITNTTHNAIAIQSSTGNFATGTVVVTENYIEGTGNRAIRIGDIKDADITINNNVMIDAADSDGQMIKATSLGEGTVNLENNYWDGADLAVAIDSGLTAPTAVGLTAGTWDADVSDYVAAGYEAVETDEGYVVQVADVTVTVADVDPVTEGESTYINLTAAIDTETYESVRWQYRTTGDWLDTKLFGYDTTTLRVPVGLNMNGRQFRCVVTGVTGTEFESNAITLTVNPKPVAAPVITGDLESTDFFFIGQTGTARYWTLEVTAEGEDLTYQWYQMAPGASEWTACEEDEILSELIKDNQLSYPADVTTYDHYQFKCVVSNEGGSVESNAIMLHAVVLIEEVYGPEDVTVTVGEQDYVTFTVMPEVLDDHNDMISGYTFQWQYFSKTENDWVNSTASGYDGQTLRMPVDLKYNGRQFRCLVTTTAAYASTTTISDVVTLTIEDIYVAQIGTAKYETLAEAVEAVEEGDTILLLKDVDEDPITISKTISFLVDHDGHDYNPFNAIVAGEGYVRDVSGAPAYVDPDGYTSLYIFAVETVEAPVIKEQPEDITVYVEDGVNAYFSVEAESEDEDDLTYQWQYYSTASKTWVNSGAAGNKTPVLTMPANTAYNGRQFRCEIKAVRGELESEPVYTDAATLTVENRPIVAPVITEEYDAEVTVTEGGAAAKLTVTIVGEYDSVQWQYSLNGKSWANTGLTGNKGLTLTVPSNVVYDGRQFKCVVTYAEGTVESEPATVTVEEYVVEAPEIVTDPEDQTGILGVDGYVYFTVEAEGELEYQWQWKPASGGTWEDTTLNGYDSDTLRVPVSTTTDGRQYRCVVSNEGGSVESAAAKLTVINPAEEPVLEIEGADFQKSGTRAYLSVWAEINGIDADSYAVEYQWQYWTGSRWADTTLTGCDTNMLTVYNAAKWNGRQYRCVIVDAWGHEYVSDSAVIKM